MINTAGSVERAQAIAKKALAGELDPLMACRDLAALRAGLVTVPEGTLDVFVAIASEIDDLPLGSERELWAAEVLETKDAEAADYRGRVSSVVSTALRELLVALKPEEWAPGDP